MFGLSSSENGSCCGLSWERLEGTRLVRVVLEIMSTVLAILRGPLDILVEISNRQFDV